MHLFPGPVAAGYLMCAVLALIAVLLRLRCRSWSNPSVVFAIFWCMMTLLPIAFVPEIEPSVNAVGYITAAVIAFSIPAVVFSWRAPLAATAARRGSASPFLSGSPAILLLATMQVFVLFCMIANIGYQGFPVGDFFVDPFALGCKYLGYRYSGLVKPFALAQVGTVLNYVAAPFAGLIVAHRRSYLVSVGVVFLCLLPSLYDIAIYADKGTVFLTLAFFYGAVVVGRIRQGSTSLLTWRSVWSTPLLLLVLVTAIGFAMINRSSAACEEQQTARIASELMSSLKSSEPAPDGGSGMKYNMRSYAFGHLFAFSAWYDHYISPDRDLKYSDALGPNWYKRWTTLNGGQAYKNPPGPTYGFWTFMAVGKYLNPTYFRSLPDGYFDEYFLRRGVLQSNIHTFFRGLIYDFTIPGSLAVLALAGLLFNLAYRRLLLNADAPLSQVMYVFFAGYLYTSYIISLLIWSSVIAAGLGTLLMLSLIGYIDRRVGSVSGASSRIRDGSGDVEVTK